MDTLFRCCMVFMTVAMMIIMIIIFMLIYHDFIFGCIFWDGMKNIICRSMSLKFFMCHFHYLSTDILSRGVKVINLSKMYLLDHLTEMIARPIVLRKKATISSFNQVNGN